MVRPVLIQYKGQTDLLEVSSVAQAEKHHPDAKIVRYADSFELYEAPKQEEPPKQEATTKAKGS